MKTTILSILFLTGFLRLCLRLCRLFVMMAYLSHALYLLVRMENGLKFYKSGKIDQNQLQGWCFSVFNQVFVLVSKACKYEWITKAACLDIQRSFWTRFTARHPFFYIRGFSVWELKEYNGILRFVLKTKRF
jgi:hypothetical protein